MDAEHLYFSTVQPRPGSHQPDGPAPLPSGRSTDAQSSDRCSPPINQAALIEDAEIGRGDTVLDIATGPGEPALSVAAVVGPEGKVVGIDPIPEMVAGARRAADRRGLKNVQFDVAFADHLPFPDDAFDAAISRFGVMFFASPVDGIRELLRVLKPGRKMALAVWHFAHRNPFHYTLSRIMDRYVEPTPVAPDTPDAFRFAISGKLAEILAAAGVTAAVRAPLPIRYRSTDASRRLFDTAMRDV